MLGRHINPSKYMHRLSDTLSQVKLRINQAATKAKRNADDITLLAVSKRHSADKITRLFEAGQRDFGENYLQEALEKIERINNKAIVWHFIGPIQSNKTAKIAEHFHWVHSVDRLKIAQRLSKARPDNMPKLNVCIQVNIDDENGKSGIKPHELFSLAREIRRLPNLHLRGLMAIPRPKQRHEEQKQAFRMLREQLHSLNNKDSMDLDTLSMGMSGDLEAAIAEGATIVRIGTALFGPREVKPN